MELVVLRAYSRWAARVVAATVVLALSAGAVAGGRTYVWCIPMQRVMPQCCMKAMRDRARPAVPTVERNTYTLHTIGTLPVARIGEAASEGVELGQPASTPVVSLLLPRVSFGRTNPTVALPPPPPVLATGPPSAGDRLAMLRVYRC